MKIRSTLLSFVFVLSAVGVAGASPVDMTGWTLVETDPGDWNYSNPDATTGRLDEAVGSSSAEPAFVVSNFALPATGSFTITLEMVAGGDDDFIGFAINYQDIDNFYLVDWKRVQQTFNWGEVPPGVNDDTAEAGLKFKRVVGGYTNDGLWGGSDGLGVTTLAGETGSGWAQGVPAVFDVTLTPGNINVELDGMPLFDVNDATFQGGRIALYGFSQDNIEFIVSNVIPEPTTALLIGLGLVGLARRGRRP